MADEWQTQSVDQIRADTDRAIAIGPFGSRMKADVYVSEGVPVIRGNNISDTRKLGGEFVFVSEATADELSACNVFAGDLVFPHRGAIGEVAIVPDDGAPRYMLSTSLMKLTCNKQIVDPVFIFYFFRSDGGRHALLQHASTVGTPGIGQPLTSLRSIRVPVPPLDEQRAIAEILGALDDKIELNRRMNETLEDISQAIFKSWFVHFDPVRTKLEDGPDGMDTETGGLFPNAFNDSDIGPIPTGWRVGKVDALVSLSREALNPLSAPDQVFDHYSIPAFDEGRRPIRQRGEEIRSNKLVVREDCVLLSRLNPRIPRVWLPLLRDDVRSVCSTEFAVAVPNPPFTREFIYGLFGSWNFQETLATLVTGTSGSHQRVKPPDLLDMSVLIPDRSTVRAFSELTRPLLAKAWANIAESETLASLRDNLIPKLISGEIRIGDAERMAEATVGN